jgi:hypothetical protein
MRVLYIPDLGAVLFGGSELMDGMYVEPEREISTFRSTTRLRAAAIISKHDQLTE